MLEWDKLVKRYVWDDTKTPYLVPVARLTATQAGNELTFHTLLAGVVFAVVAVVSLSERLPHGAAAVVSLYAFSGVCAAVVYGITKYTYAAVYCATAPAAGLIYLLFYGFHPELGWADKVLLVALLLLWLRYGWRLLAIARSFPGSLAPDDGE